MDRVPHDPQTMCLIVGLLAVAWKGHSFFLGGCGHLQDSHVPVNGPILKHIYVALAALSGLRKGEKT